MNSDYKKARIQKIKNFVVITFILLLIGVPVFGYFKVSTESRFALREAKNIKLAYQMLAIEYYGKGKTIYNPNKPNGMTDGVEDRLQDVTENKGDIFLKSYDKNNRLVTSFVYETKSYRVLYELDKDGKEHWKVDFFFTIQQYGGE